MENSRPQLSLDDLRRLKWLLGGVLALLGTWAVFYLEADALPHLAVTTVLVPLVLLRPDLPGRVPPWLWKAVVPVLVLLLGWDFFSSGQLMASLVRLNILLLLFRAVTYRQRREDLQLVVLSLFLIVVAGVLTVALAFVLQILLFAACALLFLLVVTIIEAGGEDETPGVGVPAWALGSWDGLGRRVLAAADWRVTVLAGVLFAGVVALSALLFLTIPRFQMEHGLFLERLSKQSTTGFSDTIQFGEVVDIMNDTSLALRVDMSDRSELPAEPYWRMLVLDDYSDGSFRMSPGLQSLLRRYDRPEVMVRGTGFNGPMAQGQWTVYLEPGVSRFLPLPGQFDEVRFRETQRLQWLDAERVLALREDPPSMLAYRLTGVNMAPVLPDWRFRVRLERMARRIVDGDRLLAPVPVMSGLPLTDPDERTTVLEMAAEITGGQVLAPEEFARRAVDWLGRRHGYSMQVTLPAEAGDPLVRWMRSTLPGHCELFAGSFTLLARAAGHASRVVVGFKGGTWNGYEDYFMVRNSDAHAWCEIWDGEGAWIRVDPTSGAVGGTVASAGGAVDSALAASAGGGGRGAVDRSWEARLDSIRILWYRRIVSFDHGDQAQLVSALREVAGEFMRTMRDRVERWGSDFKERISRPWDLSLLVPVAAVAAAVALSWFALRAWRDGWARWQAKRGRGLHPVRRDAARWLRRLDAAAKSAGALGAVAAGEHPEVAVARAALERLRFGPPEEWSEAPAVFRRARRATRTARRVARNPGVAARR